MGCPIRSPGSGCSVAGADGLHVQLTHGSPETSNPPVGTKNYSAIPDDKDLSETQRRRLADLVLRSLAEGSNPDLERRLWNELSAARAEKLGLDLDGSGRMATTADLEGLAWYELAVAALGLEPTIGPDPRIGLERLPQDTDPRAPGLRPEEPKAKEAGPVRGAGAVDLAEVLEAMTAAARCTKARQDLARAGLAVSERTVRTTLYPPKVSHGRRGRSVGEHLAVRMEGLLGEAGVQIEHRRTGLIRKRLTEARRDVDEYFRQARIWQQRRAKSGGGEFLETRPEPPRESLTLIAQYEDAKARVEASRSVTMESARKLLSFANFGAAARGGSASPELEVAFSRLAESE